MDLLNLLVVVCVTIIIICGVVIFVNRYFAFIEGEVLALERKLNRLGIVSYQTTDKIEPRLHCLSF